MPHFKEVPIRPKSGGGPSATLPFFLLIEAVTQRRRIEREQQRLTTVMVAPSNINIPISAPRGKRGNQSTACSAHIFR